MIRKIAEGHISRVSGKVMSAVIRECEDFPSTTVKDIIELLEFYDETASRVLAGHHRQIPTNNPLLKPWVFGVRFYAYNHFNAKLVTICDLPPTCLF
ncbi:hypothetical protein ACRW2U_00075 [Escherichia coli]